jgi:hypothetical protein
MGGGVELGGGGGGGDLSAPVFVYCVVVGSENEGGGNVSILSTKRYPWRGRSLGDGREYFSGFSKEVSLGVCGRFTLLRALLLAFVKRESQAWAVERRKRMKIFMPTNYLFVSNL